MLGDEEGCVAINGLCTVNFVNLQYLRGLSTPNCRTIELLNCKILFDILHSTPKQGLLSKGPIAGTTTRLT